ncbi:hypothetical protein ACXZ66_04060 [Corynebacterium sp. S7]
MTSTIRPRLTRLGAVFFAVLVCVVITAWPAAAQEEEEQGALARGQEKCMSVDDSRSVLDQLVTDGAITQEERDEAAGTFGFDEDKVAEIQANNSERWDEIATHHEEERGAFGEIGRAAQNLVCWVGSPASAAVNAVNDSPFWEDPIGKFTQSVLEGNTESLNAAMTLWMDFSTTSVDVDANTQGVKNIVMGVSGLALAASFIIGGWRIASARRGGLQEGFSDLNENIVRWLVFSIAVPVMVPGAMVASDMLADAIMDEFGGTEELVNLGALGESEFGPIVTLVLALIMLIGSVVQILAHVTRVLLVPIAAGLSPLFAALSFSDTGRQGLNHLVSFMIAAIAFKPVSALLYAVVLWNVSGTDDIGMAGGVINALMLGIAGFAAPALVRAIVPAVSQAGGGGAAPMLAGATGIMAAGMGAVGSMAGRAGGALSKAGSSTGSGVNNVAGSSSGGGSTGPSAAGSGAPGPTGPSGPRGGSGGGGGGAGRSNAPTQAGSQPSGSRGGGGGRASALAGSQPSGANAGGGRAAAVSRSAGRGAAGAARGVGRGAGRVLATTGTAASVVGTGVRRAGEAGHRAQGLFDDSIGVPGGYAGQAHR